MNDKFRQRRSASRSYSPSSERMMRGMLAVSLMLLAWSSHAQEAPPALKIGDPAPRLVVTQWLRGEPISEFEKGKVYVLDLWATWCGPCIQSLPELDRLSAEFESKGVYFIAATSADEQNTLEAATDFVAGPGKAYKFRFAFCKHEDLNLTYLIPAGQKSIPCTFVVGPEGKLAFIGAPRDLHLVLPLILSGAWKDKSSMEQWNSAKAALAEIYGVWAKDPVEGAKQLASFESKHPIFAKTDDVLVAKLLLPLQAGQFESASAAAEKLLAVAQARQSGELAAITGKLLGNPELNPQKQHIALASKAFDLATKMEKVNLIGVRLDAIDVHLAANELGKASAAGKEAIEHAGQQGIERKKIVEAAVKKKLEPGEKMPK